jgi:hypothetical protein
MPRRSLFKEGESNSLLLVPDSYEELGRHYTISDTDISIIKQHRGKHAGVSREYLPLHTKIPTLAT